MFATTATTMVALFLLILCRTQRYSLPSELLKLPVSFALFSYLVFTRPVLVLSVAYLQVTINSARRGMTRMRAGGAGVLSS
jgi:hypothetical protein